MLRKRVMASSSIVIFYATGSKQIRGVLVPDSDEELKALNPKAPAGETMLTVPAFVSPQRGIFDPANNQYVIDCVTQATGMTPPDPSCAVVDANGVVEAVIAADETLDALPGKTLVQAYSPEIVRGCTYDGRTKQFTVPEQVFPATTDRQGQPVPERIVPAKLLTRAVADGKVL